MSPEEMGNKEIANFHRFLFAVYGKWHEIRFVHRNLLNLCGKKTKS